MSTSKSFFSLTEGASAQVSRKSSKIGSASGKSNSSKMSTARCQSDTGFAKSSSEAKTRKSGSRKSQKVRNMFSDLESTESLLSEYECLEKDNHKLHEKLLSKNQSLDDLEGKLDKLQCQLLTICYENKMMAEKLTKAQADNDAECQQELESKLKSYMDNANNLSCSIKGMESTLKQLRNELDCVKKEKQIERRFSAFSVEMNAKEDRHPSTSPCSDQTAMKLKQLQAQYAALQSEFCDKEKQCKEMAGRMKNVMETCNNDEDRIVNEALKKQVDKMVAEIADYKFFINELQEQNEIYQDKFMKAQEKVEHQRYLLENLEMNNKEVEAQINEEISRIKEKFQEKLSELCPYPQMYEESRLELEESKKTISSLETDLKATVAALCKSKCELEMLQQQPDESLEKKCKQLQCEVEMMEKKYCGVKSTKECLEGKLCAMKKELEILRKHSTKIIATTKACAEKNRNVLHEHINSLEVNLAKCRASANISLTEKEETIKKMKQELTSLCGHFNDCQGQIKQLKNQVTYLTNQRHNIRPEDLNKIDCCFPDV